MDPQPAIDRSCGACSLCCSVYEISIFKKPEWKWCTHCERGVGCRIYAQRPRVCRKYVCMWRAGSGAMEDRPDRIGVMMDIRRFKDAGMTLMVNESEGSYLHAAGVCDRIRACMDAGLCVWVRRREGRDMFFLPSSLQMTDHLAHDIVENDMHVEVY